MACALERAWGEQAIYLEQEGPLRFLPQGSFAPYGLRMDLAAAAALAGNAAAFGLFMGEPNFRDKARKAGLKGRLARLALETGWPALPANELGVFLARPGDVRHPRLPGACDVLDALEAALLSADPEKARTAMEQAGMAERAGQNYARCALWGARRALSAFWILWNGRWGRKDFMDLLARWGKNSPIWGYRRSGKHGAQGARERPGGRGALAGKRIVGLLSIAFCGARHCRAARRALGGCVRGGSRSLGGS